MARKEADRLHHLIVAASYWLEQEENQADEEAVARMEDAKAWAQRRQTALDLRALSRRKDKA